MEHPGDPGRTRRAVPTHLSISIKSRRQEISSASDSLIGSPTPELTTILPPILDALGRIDLPKGYKLDHFTLSWSHRVKHPTWRIERAGQAVFETQVLSGGRASALRQEACRMVDAALMRYVADFTGSIGMRPIYISAPAIGPSRSPLDDPSKPPLDLGIMARLIETLARVARSEAAGPDAADSGFTCVYDLQRKLARNANRSRCETRRTVTLIGDGPSHAPRPWSLEEIVTRTPFSPRLLNEFQAEWDTAIQGLFPGSIPTAITMEFKSGAPSGHDRIAALARLTELEACVAHRYGKDDQPHARPRP